jgi:hypothetical protein
VSFGAEAVLKAGEGVLVERRSLGVWSWARGAARGNLSW